MLRQARTRIVYQSNVIRKRLLESFGKDHVRTRSDLQSEFLVTRDVNVTRSKRHKCIMYLLLQVQ